ncbi:SLBB domain-containing protein [Gammaproteobacteria bacterium]|nr:SLBB domain-containing protein [Gammaproteobacteria bacterium]
MKNQIFCMAVALLFSLNGFSQNLELLNDLPESVQQDILQQAGKAEQRGDAQPNFMEVAKAESQTGYSEISIIDQLELDSIQIFGSQFFEGQQLNNLGSSKLVGQNYIVGPGDIFEIKMNASSSIQQSSFLVNQNGAIFIDSIGSISLLGLPQSKAIDLIKRKARSSRSVKDISISIIETKNVEIFIYGESKNPNKYLIRSNSSILDLIALSGGVSDLGSYRMIEHIRDNKTLRTFDLYDYLIAAKSFAEYNFLEGDLIFIKPYTKRVQISGGVKRPAIYELTKEEDFSSLLNFSLGMTTDANKPLLSIERIGEGGSLQVYNPFLNINKRPLLLNDGDKVFVPVFNNKLKQYVSFEGAFSSEINITKDSLISPAFSENALFANNSYPFFMVKKNSLVSDNRMMHVGISDFQTLKDGDTLFALSKQDVDFLNSSYVYEFMAGLFSEDDLESIRAPYNQFINNEEMLGMGFDARSRLDKFNQKNCYALEAIATGSNQKSFERLAKTFSNYNLDKSKLTKPVFCPKIFDNTPDLLHFALNSSVLVSGHSLMNGLFPISPGTNLSKFINFLGGIDVYSSIENIQIQDIKGNIKAINANNYVNQTLSPGDIILFGQREYLAKEKPIKIVGQVMQEGLIPFKESMTLMDVISAAGGYKNDAFTVGGVLVRQSAKENERQAIDKSYQDLVSAIAGALSSGFIQTDITSIIPLLKELTNVEPTGRIITEFNALKMQNNKSLNIIMEPGDEIFIPRFKSTITIVGEVLAPVTLPYDKSLNARQYIDLAGGLTSQAAKKKIYLVHPNGRAYPVSGGIFSSNNRNVLPGSLIYVPRNPTQYGTLRIAETIAPIISSLAISAASLNSISSK